MSTNVTTFRGPPPGGLPTRAPRVQLSPQLGYLADAVAVRGAAALPAEIGPGLRTEAERAIELLERMCEPASHDVIAQWMNLVSLSVTNPPDPGPKAGRIALVIETSGDLPRACWTSETRAGYARSGERAMFWPSDAEVDAFLRPIGRGFLALLRALYVIRDKGLEGRPVPARREEPGAEERAIVAGLVRQFSAEAAEGARDRDRLFPDTSPDLRPLRDATLQGAELAAFRARTGNPVPVEDT